MTILTRLLTKQCRQRRLQVKAHGFSLVEMMMQLTLLITVTVPLVMMLNTQKEQIEENQLVTENESLTSQLFDNLVMQHPDPIDAFGVPSNARVSIYCDPGSAVKTKEEYLATCTNKGEDVDKGPFFTRTLQYTANNQGIVDNRGIKVTVQLYKSKNGNNETPYYEASREYQIDTYRVNVGSATDATTMQTPYRNDFAQKIAADRMGHLWYPEYITARQSPSSGGNNLAYNTGCSGYGLGTVTAEAPYNTFRDISCTGGAEYLFKATPGMLYDVNLYFVLPANFSATNSCLTNTHGVSCALADIRLESLRNDHNNVITLGSFENYDIAAATGPGLGNVGKGTVLHTTVVAPVDAADLRITVRPTVSSARVYLAGIELVRRSDQ